MKTLLVFVSILFFSPPVFACDEGRAELQDTGLPAGALEMNVCRDGILQTTTVDQLTSFIGKAPTDFDQWAGPMSEGQATNTIAFLSLVISSGNSWEEIPMTNKTYAGEVSPEQTKILKAMVAKWNSVMEITPERRTNILDMDEFNAAGRKNLKALDSLALKGRQCNDGAGNLEGHRLKFADDETITILPVSMEEKSKGKFEIKFYGKSFLSPLTPLETRTLEFREGSNKVKWIGPKGEFFLEKQSSKVVSTTAMFSATAGMNSGRGSALCNAEAEVEKLYPAGAGPGSTEGIKN